MCSKKFLRRERASHHVQIGRVDVEHVDLLPDVLVVVVGLVVDVVVVDPAEVDARSAPLDQNVSLAFKNSRVTL